MHYENRSLLKNSNLNCGLTSFTPMFVFIRNKQLCNLQDELEWTPATKNKKLECLVKHYYRPVHYFVYMARSLKYNELVLHDVEDIPSKQFSTYDTRPSTLTNQVTFACFLKTIGLRPNCLKGKMEEMEGISVGLQKVCLKNLNPNLQNVLIVGIIIGKQRPHKFIDTKAPAEVYKGVWNFTFRDSPQDYINVTYWGPSEVIFQANDKFHTGDVVEIINPKVNIRKFNDYGEQFHPMVTSPFSLSLSEKSSLILHEGNPLPYSALLRYPTKPIVGFLPLRDIHNRGASIKDYVNILAVVRGLGQVRSITSKTNEIMQVRTVEIFDYTSPSLKLEIWEPEIIQRSEKWRPRFTALFLTDLRVQWSKFHRQFVVSVTGRTIITENPEGREVQSLLDYAKNAPIETFEIVDHLINALPDPITIQDVMSVKQIQDKINIHIEENGLTNKQFTALLFAFVTTLDLDGLSKTLMIKCGRCKIQMKGSNCENSECPTVYEGNMIEPEFNFDIRITLSDHTGTLTNCRFRGHAVEQALSCTARDFSNMSDDDKCSLKWKYLMERCAVSIAIMFVGNHNPVISVIQLRSADSHEVSRRLPIY